MEIKRDVPKCKEYFAEFQQKSLILPCIYLIKWMTWKIIQASTFLRITFPFA